MSLQRGLRRKSESGGLIYLWERKLTQQAFYRNLSTEGPHPEEINLHFERKIVVGKKKNFLNCAGSRGWQGRRSSWVQILEAPETLNNQGEYNFNKRFFKN